MKKIIKLFSLLAIVAVIGLATVTESYNKTIPVAKEDEPSAKTSITVFTNPACYSGAVYAYGPTNYIIPSTGSSYHKGDIDEGTYTVRLCCGNYYGSATVTVGPAPYNHSRLQNLVLVVAAGG